MLEVRQVTRGVDIEAMEDTVPVLQGGKSGRGLTWG